MITVSGYQTQEHLQTSALSSVYRAQRLADGLPVVLKVLKPYPSNAEIARFQLEYEIGRHLALPGVVCPYAFESYQHSHLIVMEDFGGQSLKHWLKQHGCFDVTRFMDIALQLVDILGQVHQRQVIHKDINPSNIIWNPASNTVKLIDFGISTRISRESPLVRHPNVLEGSLSYLSPEQTGRMNRAIDYRSDFYSLGVTFYELLTGQLPFDSHDPMALVHSHIAKTPLAVDQLNPQISPALSQIIQKLMAKMAEDRYQGCAGIKADLMACLSQTTFELGLQDRSDQFQIPQKLYGRDAENVALLQAFERASLGKAELLLVAGSSGIGKSALVHEVHKPIVQKRGFFIAGKFDQYKRNIPYSSLIQALQALVQQLLSESPQQIVHWREKLLNALAGNAQVMIELIPALELILGKQAPVTPLPPTEAQNRFNLVLQAFFSVLGGANHPLVLFLDDLQWADLPSLKLIERLMTSRQEHYLLLIGAYRDNEVSDAHPLMAMLHNIQHAGVCIPSLKLAPLDLACVQQLIAETLHCSLMACQSLAELCWQRTDGNPFFLSQLLHAMYEDGSLQFDTASGTWQWDMPRLAACYLTDNVVELMVAKLQKLSPATQQVLQFAACIGNVFDLKTLAVVNEQSAFVSAEQLWPALLQGFIVPQGDDYKYLQVADDGAQIRYRFLHDRVQQAACALISEAELIGLRLKIGRLLLHNTAVAELEDALFDILELFNGSLNLLLDATEKRQIAALNLRAGLKARLSGAYQAALRHMSLGISLLAEDSWQHDYDLSLALYRGQAEASYLAGHFEQADQLYPRVLQHAASVLDKVSIYAIQMAQYQLQGRFQEAIAVQREGLALLGIEIPENEAELLALLSENVAQIQINLQGRAIEDLLHAPLLSEPATIAAMRLLMGLVYAAYLSGQKTLHALASLKISNLSLQHGNSELAAVGYVTYAFFSASILGDFKQGQRFGQLALALADQFNYPYISCAVYLIYGLMSHHWHHPLADSFHYLESAFELGLRSGDFASLGCLVAGGAAAHMAQGENLNQLLLQTEQQCAFLQEIKQFDMFDCATAGTLQSIRALLGQTKHPCCFDDEQFSEAHFLAQYAALPLHLASFYYAKIRNAYLFADWQNALCWADQLPLIEQGLTGQMPVSEANFYVALILLATYEAMPASDKAAHWQKITAIHAKFSAWAQHNPTNFLHKLQLITAEMARLERREFTSLMVLYQQAIDSANQANFIHCAAIANELYAQLWLTQHQANIAQLFLKEAHYLYQRWGATAKCRALEQVHGHFEPHQNVAKPLMNLSNTVSHAHTLDFSGVMKASQAISGEIVLSKLLERMMFIVLENAGAQKGLLILQDASSQSWRIEADCTIEPRQISLLQSEDLLASNSLSSALVLYVIRTHETVMLHAADAHSLFAKDPYMLREQPKSVLCLPISHQGQLTGVLYLENKLISGAFTLERLEVLTLLSTQIATSIENSRLYRNMEQKVQQRTKQLRETLLTLEQQHQQLKQSEHNLFEAKQKAEAATEAKSIFLASMSHEIRTPINGVIGLGNLLLNTPLDARQQDYTRKLVDSGESLLNIINDILDFSKIEAGKLSLEIIPFNLEQVIERAINICSLKAHNKGLALIVDYAPNIPAGLLGDPLRLQQILLNLLTNAIKFTEQGHVALVVKPIEIKHPHMTLEFQVQDTGMGLSPQQQTRLFKSFSQADDSTTRTHGGTGLGLSICKQLVELMQGEIGLKSEVNQGSCFIFTAQFDISQASALPPLAAQQLLVADQTPSVLRALEHSLADSAVELLTTDNIQQMLLYSLLQPDLIILDWKLLQQDGREVMQTLSSQLDDKASRVVLSASLYDRDAANQIATHCHIDHVIEKPFQPAALRQLLNQTQDVSSVAAPELESFDFSQLSILLVEDNAVNQLVALDFLEASRAKVDVADNGQQAFDMVSQGHYDLVLMDVQMPIMDGLTATRLIRQLPNMRQLPIIAMTAQAMEEERKRTQEAGMDAHITKPINQLSLLQMIAQWTRR